VGVDNFLAVVVEHWDVLVVIVKFLAQAILPLTDGCVGCRRVGEVQVVVEASEDRDAPIEGWLILLMDDKDVVEDFEEEEIVLAHVDADKRWQIKIDSLIDRVAGVTTGGYEERLPRDRPEITGKFFPVRSDEEVMEALLLSI